MLTWRTAVIVAVLALAFAVVWPSAQAAMDQQDMLDGLRADAATAQEEVDDLSAELDRWDDDAYIEAQARERLAYVFPGETAYRVVDPETVEDAPVEDGVTADAPAVTDADTWYDALWQSVERAGDGAAPVEDADGAGADAPGSDAGASN